MVAEAEPDHIRLVCVGGDEDSAPHHVRKWMETQPLEGIEVTVQFDEDLASALEILKEGEADLLAVSGSTWHLWKGAPDTMVAAALPRRDENHILVADDRLNFLPHKTVILSNHKLQRRQLRRYRSDFRILKPSAFAEEEGYKAPPEGRVALQSWMEDLRGTKIIGGYVTEKHIFDLEDMKHARMFNLTTDTKKDGHARFLPSPLQGLTLLISRKGFPKSLAERIGDSESLTAWACEQVILQQINPEILDRIGVVVRHRQIASLLNQAEEEKDLLRSTSLLDSEGDVIDTASMVEILIEIVGRTGERTLLLERLIDKEDAVTHARLLVVEWENMLGAVTAEHAEDIRLGPARPAFLDL